MADGKLAVIIFEGGMALALISMVIGPFEIKGLSLAASSIACFLALVGMPLAFNSWNEPEVKELDEPENPKRNSFEQ